MRTWQTGVSTKWEFQFLLVRLKEEKEFYKIPLNEFQFLLVRLKVRCGLFKNDNQTIFQFLLVRLKAVRPHSFLLLCRISIPFGAIKRVRTRDYRQFDEISIPFGAIKSRVLPLLFFLPPLYFNSFWCD